MSVCVGVWGLLAIPGAGEAGVVVAVRERAGVLGLEGLDRQGQFT